MNQPGLIVLLSDFPPRETMDLLAAAVAARGMAVVARVDHAAAAANAGLELRPTELLIFGNPLAGTPLMQAAQTLGIDLPLKALVWEDSEGKTWLGYNDPEWLAGQHGVDARTHPTLSKMTEALASVAKQATSRGQP